MSYFSFGQDDLIQNTLVAYPRMEFYVYQREVFFNNAHHLSGAFTGSVPNVPNGHVNLYEYNVDRTDQSTSIPGGTGLILPYIVKSGDFVGVQSVTKAEWTSDFENGDLVYGRYPLSASVSKKFLEAGSTHHSTTGSALQNTLNYYSYLSPHYLY